jgi:hypothetical protein
MKIKREDLESLYLDIEKARMKLWDMIYSPEVLYNDDGNTVEHSKIVIDKKPGVYGIVVKEVLPRIAGITKGKLDIHWAGIMNYALKDLGVKYKKILCVIKVYSPSSYWDVDNRATSIIIDSLRYNNIIPEDKYENLSLLTMGYRDTENPRTEIYIMEHPEDDTFYLSEKA